MKTEQTRVSEASAKSGGLEGQVSADLPLIASVRTGLASKDDALMQRLPSDYSGKTVGDVITYLTGTGLTDDQRPLSASVRKEVDAAGSVIVINGKTARSTDSFDKYVALNAHTLPGGAKKQYRELEIEVSAVQQGGYRFPLRN
jgi:hypothetical protein